MKPSVASLSCACAGFLWTACAVLPEGEHEERERALAAGQAFEESIAPVPLPASPSLEDYLHTAFHASAALAQRYWEWRAALERIPQVASPPDPAFSFGSLFGGPNMTAWNRTTLGLQNMPSMMIPPPSKLASAGRATLEEARAAGLRFEAEKFRVQGEVTALYLDLALHGELLAIQAEQLRWIELAAGESAARLRTAGVSETELLRARTELDLARNDLANLHAQLPPLVARLNVLLGRSPLEPLTLPPLPESRPLPVSDGELLTLAGERSPELAALAREVAGSEEALELARAARIPDFGFTLGITGNLAQMLGGMITLPLRRQAIRAGIAEAQANLRAAGAAREQYARDLAASFVLDLYVLRNAERQEELFRNTLLPRAELLARTAEAALATGRAQLTDVAEAQRAVLDTRLVLALLRVERGKALAALESWSAVDVEALHPVRASAGM